MENDFLKLIPMWVSAFAASVSVYFARQSQKTQAKLLENNHDIQLISDVIEILKCAKAVQEYASDFADEDFMRKSDLSIVPSKIAKLLQNRYIQKHLNIEQWNLPITEIENKISQLSEIRVLLLK